MNPGAGEGDLIRPSAAGVRTPALGRALGLVRSDYAGLPSMAGRGCDEGG
jgi:hypothetical protein